MNIEDIANKHLLLEFINNEIEIVDVWFCRDNNGVSCTYQVDSPPILDHGGRWTSGCRGKYNLTPDTVVTARRYGKGFFGVRKGRKKILKLLALKK